jgi:hypothetical protein
MMNATRTIIPAAGLLFLLMISGIGQVTGLTYRFIEPVKVWVVHKALAIALCAAIAIHGGFLLIDQYVHFSFGQLLIPFVATYSNSTTLLGINLDRFAVTTGIFAMYGVAITVITSLLWIDKKREPGRGCTTLIMLSSY